MDRLIARAGHHAAMVIDATFAILGAVLGEPRRRYVAALRTEAHDLRVAGVTAALTGDDCRANITAARILDVLADRLGG